MRYLLLALLLNGCASARTRCLEGQYKINQYWGEVRPCSCCESWGK